jgi:hypothetical protein
MEKKTRLQEIEENINNLGVVLFQFAVLGVLGFFALLVLAAILRAIL